MALHNEIGKQGEVDALQYLQKLGYNIVAQNWRWQKIELDIIALDGNELVIVEVKTRTSAFNIDPQELIGQAKTRQLIDGADQYATLNNITNNIRIDLIVINALTKDITHYKDAIR